MSLMGVKESVTFTKLLKKITKTMTQIRYWSVLLFSVTSLFSTIANAAPVPNVSSNAPDAYFVGEQFCFDATVTNTGETGYGPYLRLITQPDFNFATASLLNLPVEVIPVAGTLPGLIDPISGDAVTGATGSGLTLLRLPIGSVVTGGIPLNVNICIDVARNAIPDVQQTDALQIQPIYEYGDTATGDNGSIIGTIKNNAITPEIIRFTEEWLAPENENPPGPQFTFPVNAIADIASDLTVSPVVFPTIIIDPERQFVGPIEITGGSGCMITATSSTGQVQTGSAPFIPSHMTSAGGKVDISCNSATGTIGESTDVLVAFSVYIIDILNPLTCTTESSPFINTGKHVVIRKNVNTQSSVPNTTLTFSLSFAVSEFATADYIRIEDTLPDGYTYVNTSSMSVGGSSYTITPTVAHNNANGQTQLTYDVSTVYGANFTPATTGIITYTAIIDETYEATGETIESNDSLTNITSIFYSLLNGAGSPGNYCTENSAATVVILPITTSKTIINQKAEYMPGDEVIFRLRMDIPSGDTRNIVFEDYFPLPVFDVGSINTSTNLVSNPNISIATGDSMGLTPTNISIDTGQNKLRINWPDVNTTTPQSIVIDVKATVTTEPFADNLFLTNLLGVASENTQGTPTTLYAGISLRVRAPALSIKKTASQAVVSANDTVGFDITVKNDGGATAYDVVINDTPQAGLSNCSAFSSSVNGTTNATGDYVIASLGVGVQAVVSLQCDIDTGVESGSILINNASVDWSSVTNGTRFTTKTSSVPLDVLKPVVEKIIISSSEAHTDDTVADLRPLTMGEIVRYQLKVELPEGHLTNLRVNDLLPSGLVFENDGSAKLAFVSTSGTMTTDIAALNTCATLNQIGDETTVNTLTPTCPISPTSTTFNSGDDVIFAVSSSIGFVANTDDDTNKEYVLIELNARVLKSATNVNGDNKRNYAQLETATLSITSTDALSPRITLVEPLLDMTKAADQTSVDAGDIITYTVNLNHVTTGTSVQQSTANAYDVQVVDILPAGLAYITNSLTATCSAGLAPTLNDNAPSGSGLLFTLPILPLGESCSMTYQTTASSSLMSDDQIVNTATMNWGSLPLAGTSPNPTGTIPQANNERTGTQSATATVELNDPIPVKSIASTNQTHTADVSADTSNDPRPVSIGEIIRYRLVTQLGEGTATGVIINDKLPDGLRFIDTSAALALVSNNNGVTSTLICNSGTLALQGDESTLASVTPTCGISATAGSFISGTDVTFNLGDLVNQDNDNNKEFIIIEFDAQVLNESLNQQGKALSNTFNIAINGITYSDSNAVIAQIIEPQIDTSIAIIPASNDVAHFTLSIENTGDATAFQIGGNDQTSWQFTLPAGFNNITNLTINRIGSVNENGTTNILQINDLVVSGGDNNVLVLQKLIEMNPAAKLVIAFDAQKIPAVTPDSSIAISIIEYSSQPTGNSPNGVRNGTDLNTGSGNTPISSTLTKNDYRNELQQELYQISGSVFEDSNTNTTKDGGEQGLANVGVVLYDGTNCQSISTDSSGKYSFFPLLVGSYTVYESANARTPTPLLCPPASQDPSAYLSTTANSKSVTISNANIKALNFADIRSPLFSPNHSEVILPNGVVLYPHIFTPRSTGTVTFNTVSNTPITAGWSNILYNDNNCNGLLEGADAPVGNNLAMIANSKRCLVNKVFAPSNAASGEKYNTVINATVNFNGNTIAGSQVLKVTDATTVSANDPVLGSSKLVLRKTVENVTQGTAETDTQNQARPSDILQYRIYYRNAGTGPITDLKINDAIPAFTTLNGTPTCQLPLPASLTSCSHQLNDEAIKWVFGVNDVLKGGSEGVVSYQVIID